MIVVSDTSVIINLAIIKQLDLLPLLFGSIVIPKAVYELNADRILMDEALGRELAVRLHLKPIGILGILLEAKKGGHITAIKPCMDNLIQQARFFIGQTLYDRVLVLAQE